MDAQQVITIKGKVQFPDNRLKMEIVERNGFDKTVLDSCEVNADGTYELKMKVERPGSLSVGLSEMAGGTILGRG